MGCQVQHGDKHQMVICSRGAEPDSSGKNKGETLKETYSYLTDSDFERQGPY